MAVPVAAREVVYATLIVPSGREAVVITGGVVAAMMIMDNALVAELPLLLAFTVKGKVPAAVGMPEIVPFVLRVSPLGRLPLSNAQVMGVVPVAARV